MPPDAVTGIRSESLFSSPPTTLAEATEFFRRAEQFEAEAAHALAEARRRLKEAREDYDAAQSMADRATELLLEFARRPAAPTPKEVP